MAKQTLDLGRRWFVLHTYSGYEDNVKRNLDQRVESFDMQDKIFNVIVPKEKKIKIKNGKRTVVEEKIFPGYVLVEMIVTDDSWYVVRNTPNVTGFVGSGTTPTPIDQKEIDELQKRMGVEEPTHKIDLDVDTPVRIIDGPFKNFEGKISNVDEARGKVKVLVSMFGRETPVELDALQVKKI
ncbi:MAG: transcription termination/antitermination protein NusG [Candidatus Magasanikbacteria bacterium RIFCSPHIGHO2_02_FULL_51_14]|uniref:Transcription termination/antitermination protein NusG n=1 Tax=Candidatus Magasanikbacteria bacterium RIFCSPHIGHO2_02_FULL_51_14 TaxID=1798683 RepID=A0A1F6MFA4_9BACT|nr:MAG: transcription termination/antitermination protein NusG [Candidatus Magasanikbacteria bacterium RIFCSPHIGHO2_02_FULL_51_14]